jgi:hypothetical protein
LFKCDQQTQMGCSMALVDRQALYWGATEQKTRLRHPLPLLTQSGNAGMADLHGLAPRNCT